MQTPISAKDIVAMRNGTLLLNVHTIDQCAGEPCVIHNPSSHHMGLWPHLWDDVAGSMWRSCPHGFGHPDPDDVAFQRRAYGHDRASKRLIHGCDGCCQPDTTSIAEMIALPPGVQEFLDDPSTGSHRSRPDRSTDA